MFQEMSRCLSELGLSDRVWGGFDDDGLSLSMGVDPRVAWPVICQLIGRDK